MVRSTLQRRQAQRLDVVFVIVMGRISGGNLARSVRDTPYVFLVAVYQCFHSCVSAFIVLEKGRDREDSEKYVQKYPAAKTSTEA